MLYQFQQCYRHNYRIHDSEFVMLLISLTIHRLKNTAPNDGDNDGSGGGGDDKDKETVRLL